MGLVADAFGPLAVADRRVVVGMPAGWSFSDAAAVPIAFLTAYYALADLAGLKKGEADASEDEAQLRLHSAAAGCFGVFASGDSHRAETARDALRARLRRRRGR